MVDAIALLFACQLLGEIIHRLTGLPLPGAVIGMLLLIGWLAAVRRERPALVAVTTWLTGHLAILFVPAAVGVIEEGGTLSRYGVGLELATVVSTILTMVVSVLVFRWALRKCGHDAEPPQEPQT